MLIGDDKVECWTARAATLLLLAFLLLATLTLAPTPTHAQVEPAKSFSPTTLKLPDGPGSVQGLADGVSIGMFSGQVEYSVPIAVPATGGLAPSLALDYSGALGNGPVGVGWAMRVPAIRRSLRQGVPTYTDSDELVLEGLSAGGRLVLVPDGPYAGEYRVEGMGNSYRMPWRDDHYFEVKDSDGNTYLFGATSDARLEDEATRRRAAWLLQWVENTAGESMEFRYQRHLGEVYLAQVLWGPRDEAAGTTSYSLDVVYESRRDPLVSYRTGFKVVTGQRVRSILVRSFGVELCRYHLGYDDNDSAIFGHEPNAELPLSRLRSVLVTGQGGEGELSELTFACAQPGGTRAALLEGIGGWALETRGVTFADVDADGVSDLLRLEMGSHAFRKNYGGTFGQAQALSGVHGIALESARLIDVDGDSRAELVRIAADTWRVYELEGTEWKKLGKWPGTEHLPLGGANSALVDLNGDGRVDLIRATPDGVLVNFNTASGMMPGRELPPISSVDSPVEPGLANVRFHDALSVSFEHDRAGRLVKVSTAPPELGGTWEVVAQDAAGRVLRERYGNGVEQLTERDVLGQPQHLEMQRTSPVGATDSTTLTN
ncbi:MAG: SpvB/TcaC N-terminal domain-containing protein, partial [Pseudomonadota bacterium]